MFVLGTGIANGTTIASITNATTFVLSANATASGATPLTFVGRSSLDLAGLAVTGAGTVTIRGNGALLPGSTTTFSQTAALYNSARGAASLSSPVAILGAAGITNQIGGYGDMTTRVWYAALATGQNPNDIKDIDAVWAKVRENRDLVKKYWSSGAELMDLLAKGEIVVTDAWSGRVAALQQQGSPIGYLDPAGSYAWMEDMLILKGSPMAECEELVNFMLDPATAIAVAEGQNYPPSLDPMKVKLTEKIAKMPAFDPTGTMKSLTFADPNYWASNLDAWTKQWDRISKGG
jgi:spermidine/putrescine-binding protein